jgi:ParB family chromosome partitioning protein
MRIDKAKIRAPLPKQDASRTKQRVSTYTESYKGEYYNIEVNKLIPFKNQSRKIFDKKSLEELAKTIALHGIRQPLTVLLSEDQEGKYEIVSGERRWKAAQIVQLSKVPCLILQDKNAAEEIALIENVQRKNLHPLELMKGFKNLLDKGVCKNHQEVADKIGVARTLVVETLGLSKLPSSTQNLLINKKVKSREVLRRLLKSPQDEHDKIIRDIENKKLTHFYTNKTVQKRKNKFISIYLQKNNLIFDEDKNANLTLDQKEEVKNYLRKLISRL